MKCKDCKHNETYCAIFSHIPDKNSPACERFEKK